MSPGTVSATVGSVSPDGVTDALSRKTPQFAMFTVCPKCALTLVVTTEDLRVARGYVRCGTCSSVFNALAQLRDDRQAASAARAAETAAAPASAPARKGAEPSPPPKRAASSPPAASPAARSADVPRHAAPLAPPPAEEEGPDPPLELEPAADEVVRFGDSGPRLAPKSRSGKAGSQPEKQPAAQALEDSQVDVEIDTDYLAAMISHDEADPETVTPVTLGARSAWPPSPAEQEAPPSAPSAREGASPKRQTRPPPAPAPISVKTTAAPAPTAPAAAAAEPPPVPAEPRAEAAEASAPAARTAATAAAGATPEAAAAAVAAPAAAVAVPAAAVAAPAAAVAAPAAAAAAPAAEIAPASVPRRRAADFVARHRGPPLRLYVGAAVLLLTLLAQYVNHNREELACRASLHRPLMALYAAIGVKLVPRWDPRVYDVRQLGAAADPSGGGLITVRASVRNGAEQPRPLPLLRVTLQDRFGNRLASGDVAPRFYLPRAVAASASLGAGQRVDAEMVFADPGANAVGFEIDACLPVSGGGVACANDAAAR